MCPAHAGRSTTPGCSPLGQCPTGDGAGTPRSGAGGGAPRVGGLPMAKKDGVGTIAWPQDPNGWGGGLPAPEVQELPGVRAAEPVLEGHGPGWVRGHRLLTKSASCDLHPSPTPQGGPGCWPGYSTPTNPHARAQRMKNSPAGPQSQVDVAPRCQGAVGWGWRQIPLWQRSWSGGRWSSGSRSGW